MKKSALTLCIATMFALISISHAKSVHYPVAHFSDDYQAMIEADGDTHKIHVYKAGQNQPIISQDSELSDYDLMPNDDNKIAVNITQIPYGEQSVLIFDDVNFDDKKDLALKTGNYSCYGGPSYNIYLATGDDFVLSDAFSELAHNNCGMFGVDKDKDRQLIYTMTKSGCCYHEYSHYRVVDDVPILSYTLIDQVYLTDFNDFYYLNAKYFDKTNQERHTYLLTNQTPLFAFNLVDTGKMAVIYQSQYGIDYVLLDSNRLTASHYPNDLFEGGYGYPKVEFSYQLAQAGILPANATRQKRWQSSQHKSIKPPAMPNDDTLTFKNGDTTYTINEKNLGITVTQGTKHTFLAGHVKSKIGSLKAVFDTLNTAK